MSLHDLCTDRRLSLSDIVETVTEQIGWRTNDRVDRLEGKATLTSGLFLGRAELLRSLRHYLRAQSLGHHTIDLLEERGEERGFLERTREGHRQSEEHWNRFKGNVGETSERRGGAHMGFFERIDAILN